LYEYFVRVTPSTMLQELQSHFGVGAGALSAAIAAYAWIYSPMQLLVGGLFDYYGGRRLMILASVVVTMGCFLAMTSSQSLIFLSGGRLLQGFGSAFAFVGVMYLATVWFPENRLALLSGLATALGLLGGIFQSFISRVVDSEGWQNTWGLAGVLGLTMTLILFLGVPRCSSQEKETRLQHHSDGIFNSFGKSFLAVLCNPQTLIIGFIGSCLYLPVMVFGDLWGVQYIKMVAHVTKVEAAQIVSMLYWGWIVGAPLSGWFSDKIERRKLPMMMGCLLSCVLLLVLLSKESIPICIVHYELYVLLFVIGICSSSQVSCFVASLEINPSFAKGMAIAVVNMVINLFGGAFQYVVGRLLDMQNPSHDLSLYSAHNYRTALYVLPIMMFLGFIASLFMKESYPVDR